jgi:hypothetical protein
LTFLSLFFILSPKVAKSFILKIKFTIKLKKIFFEKLLFH